MEKLLRTLLMSLTIFVASPIFAQHTITHEAKVNKTQKTKKNQTQKSIEKKNGKTNSATAAEVPSNQKKTEKPAKAPIQEIFSFDDALDNNDAAEEINDAKEKNGAGEKVRG